VRAVHGRVDPDFLFGAGLHAAAAAPARIGEWLRAERYLPLPAAPAGASEIGGRHDSRIRSFALVFDAPVSGTRLWQGLESLIERGGEKLLRVKGIVNVSGQAQPRVIHIVQHVLYPVVTLAAWPSEDRRTRLVFIVRDLAEAEVRAAIDQAMAGA
jgi:G3E family GTPase